MAHKIIDKLKNLFFSLIDPVDLAEEDNDYNKIISLIVDEFKKNKKRIANNLVFDSIFHIKVPVNLDKELQPLWAIISETAFNKIYEDLKKEKQQKNVQLRPIYQYLFFIRQISNDDTIKVDSFSFDETVKESPKKDTIGITINENGITKSVLNFNDLIKYSFDNGEVTVTTARIKFDPELKPVKLFAPGIENNSFEKGTQVFDGKLATFSYINKQGQKQQINMTYNNVVVGSQKKNDRRFITVDLKNVENVHFKFRYNTDLNKFEIACKEVVHFEGTVLPLDDTQDLWFQFDKNNIVLEFGNKLRYPLTIKMYNPK